MKIEGCRALVTGANRGLGRVFVDVLLERGAARVYAGARNPGAATENRVSPLRLDVTDSSDVANAVRTCSDVDLLINNAGIMLSTNMLAHASADAMRREMEVNVFGLHGMIAAFAPVLGRNGGGGVVNVLSVASWITRPFNSTYCASKHAALSVSDAARIELHSQGTQVTGVYAGFIDTDMAAEIREGKTPPRQVVSRALDGVASRKNHVLADDRAEKVWRDVRQDPEAVALSLLREWNQK